MSEINRVALFGKLNTLAYKAVESATVLCKMRGNQYVEIAHWLNQILLLQDSDLHRIVRAFDLDLARLTRDLTQALEALPRGASAVSDFSSHVEEAVERGWVYGTLLFGDAQIRTAYLLVGMLKTRSLRGILLSQSKELDKIKVDRLTDELDALVGDSPERGMRAQDGFRGGDGAEGTQADGAMAPPAMGKQEALQRFSVDLTERARKGTLDPVVGREEEIRQIVDILMRRRQNNPILTGEAGVGKTAVVEGLALRIGAGDVPPPLADVTLRALDIGLLQAGASMKGEFESRLRQVIDEVQASPKPIILFVDEAHTLIGAGGAAGTGDAANLLKPALARGDLRTIAATTWAEYKKHIEKDPALTRRFQVVQVAEPSEEKALLMMRRTASVLEEHHRVQVLDEALEASVRLSQRYIAARQLPDKAVSLLDTACARVAVGQHSVPAEVEDSRKRIEGLRVEQEIATREEAIGIDTAKRQAEVAESLAAEQRRLRELEQRWKAEKTLVEQILSLRRDLRGYSDRVEGTGSDLEMRAEGDDAEPTAAQEGSEESSEALQATLAERESLLAQLHALQEELAREQGDEPLILPSVDTQAVASVVADWTGIPVGRMVKDEIESILGLSETLSTRVLGQSHALDLIAKRVQTARAGLEDPNKPIGVFLLAGPSGVGKTETALALAEALYGGEQNLITINMSEFQEAHTVSTLKGAPPGYVGYGEGGVLTEAVRRRPYSVVLLDEVEKAHSDVHEIFFQVFDKGWMEDGEGRMIDFKNTLILLTSNVGSELILNACADPAAQRTTEEIAGALRGPLLQAFPAALLGRLAVVPYYPLDSELLGRITRLQLDRIVARMKSNHDIALEYDDAVVELVASRCTEVESGGRLIDAVLTRTLLPSISRVVLERTMAQDPLKTVSVSVRAGELEYAFA